MAEIKVSQLPEATQINDEDLLMIVQGNANKKITKANAKFASGDEVYIGDTEPTGEDDDSVKIWVEPSEDSVESEGTYISNSYGVSTEIGYSEAYLNNNDSYSTSEIKTNKRWIDGKPIYRKCYTGTIPNDSSVVFSINDIDRLTNVYGVIEVVSSNKTYTYPLGHYVASSYFSGVQYEYGSTGSSVGLGIWHGSAFNGGTYKIVCEYTKTTD